MGVKGSQSQWSLEEQGVASAPRPGPTWRMCRISSKVKELSERLRREKRENNMGRVKGSWLWGLGGEKPQMSSRRQAKAHKAEARGGPGSHQPPCTSQRPQIVLQLGSPWHVHILMIFF